MTGKKEKISLITLGCAKNLVDSEVLLHQLKNNGFDPVHDPGKVDGGVVIINTCGFINPAIEESLETILHFAQARKNGQISKLMVMGCLSQRYKEGLREEIPEVDNFFGVKDLRSLVETLKGKYRPEQLMERELTTPGHYAWVKISEGCDRACAFCTIPMIRGKHVSRPVEDITKEVEILAEKGVKEIMLIAQDLSWYGRDRNIPAALSGLLKRLAAIEGIAWIRLHYAYPATFPWDILPVMRENPKICKYLDIPVQHISDRVLKMMRRGYNGQQVWDFINRIREEVPGIVLRTTLLTGHPGEREEDFRALTDFVKKARMERVGVFPYSHEEGTWAFDHYKDEVPQQIKQQRAEKIMAIQQEISSQINAAQLGKIMEVIIDRKEGPYFIARTEGDSPEVDQEVLIEGNHNFKAGDMVRVEITDSGPYDFTARVVSA